MLKKVLRTIAGGVFALLVSATVPSPAQAIINPYIVCLILQNTLGDDVYNASISDREFEERLYWYAYHCT